MTRTTSADVLDHVDDAAANLRRRLAIAKQAAQDSSSPTVNPWHMLSRFHIPLDADYLAPDAYAPTLVAVAELVWVKGLSSAEVWRREVDRFMPSSVGVIADLVRIGVLALDTATLREAAKKPRGRACRALHDTLLRAGDLGLSVTASAKAVAAFNLAHRATYDVSYALSCHNTELTRAYVLDLCLAFEKSVAKIPVEDRGRHLEPNRVQHLNLAGDVRAEDLVSELLDRESAAGGLLAALIDLDETMDQIAKMSAPAWSVVDAILHVYCTQPTSVAAIEALPQVMKDHLAADAQAAYRRIGDTNQVTRCRLMFRGERNQTDWVLKHVPLESHQLIHWVWFHDWLDLAIKDPASIDANPPTPERLLELVSLVHENTRSDGRRFWPDPCADILSRFTDLIELEWFQKAIWDVPRFPRAVRELLLDTTADNQVAIAVAEMLTSIIGDDEDLWQRFLTGGLSGPFFAKGASFNDALAVYEKRWSAAKARKGRLTTT